MRFSVFVWFRCIFVEFAVVPSLCLFPCFLLCVWSLAVAVSTGLCVGLVLLLFCRRGKCRGEIGFFATRLFCPLFLLGSSLSFGGLRVGVLWLFGVLYASITGHPSPCVFVVAGFYFRVEEASITAFHKWLLVHGWNWLRWLGNRGFLREGYWKRETQTLEKSWCYVSFETLYPINVFFLSHSRDTCESNGRGYHKF